MRRYALLVKKYEQYLDCLRAMVKELEEQPSTKYDDGCYDRPNSYMLVGHYTAYRNIKLRVLYQRINEVDKNIDRYQSYLKQAS